MMEDARVATKGPFILILVIIIIIIIIIASPWLVFLHVLEKEHFAACKFLKVFATCILLFQRLDDQHLEHMDTAIGESHCSSA